MAGSRAGRRDRSRARAARAGSAARARTTSASGRPSSLGGFEQQLRSTPSWQALLPAPAQPVEGQARDRRAAPPAPPRSPRRPRRWRRCRRIRALGQPAVAVRHPREHPLRRACGDSPRADCRGGRCDPARRQQAAGTCAKNRCSSRGREVAVDPGLADQRARPRRPGRSGTAPRRSGSWPRVVSGARSANRRRISAWSAGSVIVLLGDDLQLLRPRPVGIGRSGSRRCVAKSAGWRVLDHAQPAQRLGRQRIADRARPGARRAATRRAPAAAKRLADHRPLLGIERRAAGARGQRTSSARPSQTASAASSQLGKPASRARVDRIVHRIGCPPQPPLAGPAGRSTGRRLRDQPRHSACRPSRPALMVRSVNLAKRPRLSQRPTERSGHVSRLHCGAYHAVSQRLRSTRRRLQSLVEWHIEQGTHGLVPVGTTGESPTLSHAEHERVVELVIEAAAGRLPVIAGAGSNSTAEAISLGQARQGGRRRRASWWSRPTTTSRPRTASTPTSRRSTTPSTCRS